MLSLASDYQEGAHPKILRRLAETNLLRSPGYGTDEYCASARDKIRRACECPGAAVHFLVGGTQTNAAVISALLMRWQGVVAADTGHIATHEAGAVELRGHKVLPLPHTCGKISADAVREYCARFHGDANHEHMVEPGMLYLSQPTEYGTLYSLAELTALHMVCEEFGLLLYVDGARLAYALGSDENDVTLPDLARLCDAFYIGGTKCGALFGEALVLPDPALSPHFFTIMKQEGALLAKGRLLGIQFDTLFTDGLYFEIGKSADRIADLMKEKLAKAGYRLAFDSPTNQVFLLLDDREMAAFSEHVESSFWEKPDESHTIVRLATSWATTEEDLADFPPEKP